MSLFGLSLYFAWCIVSGLSYPLIIARLGLSVGVAAVGFFMLLVFNFSLPFIVF